MNSSSLLIHLAEEMVGDNLARNEPLPKKDVGLSWRLRVQMASTCKVPQR